MPARPDDTCAFGLYCAPGNFCFVGCADDAGCNQDGQSGPLKCDTATHQCGGCGAGGVCPPGTKCDPDGECVPGCDVSPDCPTADWQCCAGQCKNTTKDVLNCGACDDVCDPDQSTTWLCLDGGCVFQSCLPGYSDCNQDFSEGDGCEVSTLTDAENCGGCGEACSLPDAGAVCVAGGCQVGSCNAPFQNCDGLAANGCEVDLDSDPESCGDCDQSCEGVFLHGLPTCDGGTCVFGGCEAGWGNCNGIDADGCEVDLATSAQHCGMCGEPCTLPNAAAACVAGQCEIDECADSFDDCTAAPGCETNTAIDPQHCGACGAACTFPHAAGVCNGGDCQLGACDGGWADCNGNPSDGCETDITTITSCGGCGNACGTAGTSMVGCDGGQCQLTCAAGFGNCDGLSANGCEVNLASNVGHCGTCGNACPTGGGAPNCVNATCGFSSCPPNQADCDGDGSCETDTTTTQSCGACGNACSTNHATPSCAGSPPSCALSCESGWGDCNGSAADGCEQPLNTSQHCAACGAACQLPNAVTSCASGACAIVACTTGFADCNGVAADGCEVSLSTDEQHCGACNQPCSPANADGQCTNGACTIQSCDSGWLDCNTSPNDGCEVDKTGDPFNCDACGNVCSFPNAQATCQLGACQIGSCLGNFNDCDGTSANGCEANTQTSTQHCGFCGNTCASVNGAASCSFGSCSINCNAGYDNCNGAFGDGCETSLQTLVDCGSCSSPCDLPHATESCAAGTCQIVSCDPGYTNCDQNVFTGCECGSSCVAGTCQGCGDGLCNNGETAASCPGDCFCGNGSCDPGEDCSSCSGDCGPCP